MGAVKVFISSLIGGFEEFRAAASEAVETLGHHVVKAEDFPVSPGTPQQACLAAVRESDVVVLLLGQRYGYTQPSGLSATHEEYREARERVPVLVFVQNVAGREESQEALLEEVQAWSTGHFRAAFATADDLKTAVLRGLHQYELANSVGAADEAEIHARAVEMLPDSRSSYLGNVAQLYVAVAGGPHQQVLRPVDLESSGLINEIQQEAFFGAYPVLDRNASTSTGIRGNTLVLAQDRGSLALDQAGSVLIGQPVARRQEWGNTGLPVLIEEDIVEALQNAVRFSGWVLDHIDPVRRLTDVVPVVRITGTSYMAWRTRAEHAANPNVATMGMNDDEQTLTLTPTRRHRQALTHDAQRMSEDLVALLRRQIRR